MAGSRAASRRQAALRAAVAMRIACADHGGIAWIATRTMLLSVVAVRVLPRVVENQVLCARVGRAEAVRADVRPQPPRARIAISRILWR